jgi:hypothetical protein
MGEITDIIKIVQKISSHLHEDFCCYRRHKIDLRALLTVTCGGTVQKVRLVDFPWQQSYISTQCVTSKRQLRNNC